MEAGEIGAGKPRTLTRAQDFERAFRDGRRFRARPLLLIAFRREETGARVAFLTAKDVGKTVSRNRLRRRLREACRQLWSRIADQPFDLLFMGLPAGAQTDLPDLARAMEGLLRKARALPLSAAGGAGREAG
jgi:ribonuclease P protein component